MLDFLNIQELGSSSGLSQWNVRLEFRSRVRECLLQDPLITLQSSEAEFTWLLEQYLTTESYDRSRAEKCSRLLREYGASLAEQLDITGIFAGFEDVLEEMDVVVANIQDQDRSSAFHKLHWEILEYSCTPNRPYMPRLLIRRMVGVSRISQDQSQDLAMSQVVRTWNILVVVARPDKIDDIDPLTATRALETLSRTGLEKRSGSEQISNAYREMMSELGEHARTPKINFEISRPGSWKALEEILQTRTTEWHEKGGIGSWFDLVHFDVHGTIHRGEAHLVFSTASGQRPLWKSASEVGQLMRQHGIPNVVLNSCNSALVSDNPLSNLARILIECGVKAVIAMKFRFSSSAALLFNSAFYFRLFVPPGPPDLLSALMGARGTLRGTPERKARLGQIVEIPDYIIPVMYVSKAQSSGCLPWRLLTGEHYELFSNLENSMTAHAGPEFAERLAKTFSSSQLGRQQEIVTLEWLLLKKPCSNVLLMTGLAGCGKTTLAKILSHWWVYTSLVRACQPVCARSESHESVLTKLRDFNQSRTKERRLLIIDHLDAATLSFQDENAKASSTWPNDAKTEFSMRIREAIGSKDLIVMIARYHGLWLKIPKLQKYHLGGLTSYHADGLASKTLKRVKKEELLQIAIERRYIEYLNSRFFYNPAAIEYFLGRMANEHPESVVLRRPSDLFNCLTISHTQFCLGLDGHIPPIGRECVQFIFNAIDESPLGWGKTRAVFYSLAPCSSLLHRSWIDRLLPETHDELQEDDWRKTMIPTQEEANTYLDSVLLPSGWLEEFDLLLKGRRERYIRIHPIFTDIIRAIHAGSEGSFWPKLMNDIWFVFGQYIKERAKDLITAIDNQNETSISDNKSDGLTTARIQSFGQDATLRAQIEAANYLQGTLQLIGGKEYVDADAVLMFLWQVARGSQTPVLSAEMLEPCLRGVFDILVKQCAAEDRSTIDYKHLPMSIVQVARRLSTFYNQANPRLAMKFSRDGLRLALQYSGIASTWSGRKTEEIASLLMSYGFALLQLGMHFEQARRAFVCVLRLACCTVVGSGWNFVAFSVFLGLRELGAHLNLEPAPMEGLAHIRDRALLRLASGYILDDQGPDYWSIGSELLDIQFGYRSDLDLETFLFRLRLIYEDTNSTSPNGSPNTFKDQALKNVSRGQTHGDIALELNSQIILAELAMQSKDWDAACQHIYRVENLRLDYKGGDLMFNSPQDRRFVWMRYGCAMIRHGEMRNALLFFSMSQPERDGVRHQEDHLQDAEDAEKYGSLAIMKTRKCLDALYRAPGELLSVTEYVELDDLAKELILQKIEKLFPDHGLSKDQLTSLLRQSSSFPFPSEDGPITTTTTTPPSAPPATNLITFEDSAASPETKKDEMLFIFHPDTFTILQDGTTDETLDDDLLLDLSSLEEQLPSSSEAMCSLAAELGIQILIPIDPEAENILATATPTATTATAAAATTGGTTAVEDGVRDLSLE